MTFHILTLFPEMFTGPLSESIIRRAVEGGLLSFTFHNIRDWTTDRHRTVDDAPYGGGPGMVMKVEPIARCLDHIRERIPLAPIIMMSPQGERFDDRIARSLATEESLVIICGRYEGVDERVRILYPVREISIGDYVLTGGELPAMVLIDAVSRFVPGVLGSGDSSRDDSFANGSLEYPQFTRPPEFRGERVPEILLSGHHAEIARWRRMESLRRTTQRRPDLIGSLHLSPEERRFIETVRSGNDR
ncbi:MAG: tRNA (guanosine(37)-N1)-methyltransferase TrmD [Desulfuromonadia bacterium]